MDQLVVAETEENSTFTKNACHLALSQIDREALVQFILEDHAYARPYPTLTCQINKSTVPRVILRLSVKDLPVRKRLARGCTKLHIFDKGEEENLDVVNVDKEEAQSLVTYDASKARQAIYEVECYLSSLWKDTDKSEDDKISRGSWPKELGSLFDTAYRVIANYQLARLAYQSNSNEPVLRSIALQKATKRLRKAFGSVFWMPKHVAWLHGVLVDGLGSSLFLCYLEILQSLKKKVPGMVEALLLADPASGDKLTATGLPKLASALEKGWDPSVNIATKVSLDRFPSLPFVITIPSGPGLPYQTSRRRRSWNNLLSQFSKPIPVSIPAYRTPKGYVVKHYLEHTISFARSKLAECKSRSPERNVVLVGWSVGALVACKVALLDDVAALICLGFPCEGLDPDEEVDKKYWDSFNAIKCPVLFIIGSHSAVDSVEKVEALRGKMNTQTNLIVMESGDHLLRLTKTHRRLLGLTQNMIDRLLLDEVYQFLKTVLFKARAANVHTSKGLGPASPKKKRKVDEGSTEKRKKDPISLLARKEASKGDSPTSVLAPLDVSISLSIPSQVASTSVPSGLLTTSSLSTTIPVSTLSTEMITSPSGFDQSESSEFDLATPGVVKAGSKRQSRDVNEAKPSKRAKPKNSSRERRSGDAAAQNFTATLGTHKTGNLNSQRVSTGVGYGFSKVPKQPAVTLQRFPAGSFLLSGSNVRLQGGTNIVYLQPSASGSAQLIQRPLTTSNEPSALGTTSSLSSNFPQVGVLSAAGNSKSTDTYLLHNGKLIPTLFKSVVSNSTVPAGAFSSVSSTLCSIADAGVRLPTMTSTYRQAVPRLDVGTASQSEVDENQLAVSQILPVDLSDSLSEVGGMRSSAETFVYSEPRISQSSNAVASTAVPKSTLMTHLSPDDLKYLASLISKQTGSTSVSLAVEPLPAKMATVSSNSGVKSLQENSLAARFSLGSLNMAKQAHQSLYMYDASRTALDTSSSDELDRSAAGVQSEVLNSMLALSKDSSHVKAPRVKSADGVSVMQGMHTLRPGLTTAVTNKLGESRCHPNSSHVIPLTLAIPLSTLTSSLSGATSSYSSKSVPGSVLSAYLAQHQGYVFASTDSFANLSPVTCVPQASLSSFAAVSTSTPLAWNPVSSMAVNFSQMPTSKIIASTLPRSVLSAAKYHGVMSVASVSPSAAKAENAAKKSGTITLRLPSQMIYKDGNSSQAGSSEIQLFGMTNDSQVAQTVIRCDESVSIAISDPGACPSSLFAALTTGSIDDATAGPRMESALCKPLPAKPAHPHKEPLVLPSNVSSSLPVNVVRSKGGFLFGVNDAVANTTPPRCISGLESASALTSQTESPLKSVDVKSSVNDAFDVSTFINKNFVKFSNDDSRERKFWKDSQDDVEAQGKTSDNGEDAVDFSILPSSPNEDLQSLGDASEQKSNVQTAKVHLNSYSSIGPAKNLLDLAKARVRLAKLKSQSSCVSASALAADGVSSAFTGSRLRLDPLQVCGDRSRLTAVVVNPADNNVAIVSNEVGLDEVSAMVGSTPNNVPLIAPVAETARQNAHANQGCVEIVAHVSTSTQSATRSLSRTVHASVKGAPVVGKLHDAFLHSPVRVCQPPMGASSASALASLMLMNAGSGKTANSIRSTRPSTDSNVNLATTAKTTLAGSFPHNLAREHNYGVSPKAQMCQTNISRETGSEVTVPLHMCSVNTVQDVSMASVDRIKEREPSDGSGTGIDHLLGNELPDYAVADEKPRSGELSFDGKEAGRSVNCVAPEASHALNAFHVAEPVVRNSETLVSSLTETNLTALLDVVSSIRNDQDATTKLMLAPGPPADEKPKLSDAINGQVVEHNAV